MPLRWPARCRGSECAPWQRVAQSRTRRISQRPPEGRVRPATASQPCLPLLHPDGAHYGAGPRCSTLPTAAAPSTRSSAVLWRPKTPAAARSVLLGTADLVSRRSRANHLRFRKKPLSYHVTVYTASADDGSGGAFPGALPRWRRLARRVHVLHGNQPHFMRRLRANSAAAQVHTHDCPCRALDLLQARLTCPYGLHDTTRPQQARYKSDCQILTLQGSQLLVVAWLRVVSTAGEWCLWN